MKGRILSFAPLAKRQKASPRSDRLAQFLKIQGKAFSGSARKGAGMDCSCLLWVRVWTGSWICPVLATPGPDYCFFLNVALI